jgi:kinesin family protein 20
VSGVEEAMLLLRLGLQHRHVAHTKLNYNSSRSHSIYTIKLIRLANVDKPTRALVNR